MVARIITGKSLRGVLLYNEQKVQEGQARLLLAGMFLQEAHALTLHDKLRRFERLTARSPQVKTNAVHISLNFAIGEKLKAETLCRIATAYLDKIGFGGQPYLVYQHLDAAHPHLHLVTTNIRANGKRIDLHNIGRTRSEPARKELERSFGLVRAEDQKPDTRLRLVPFPPEQAIYGHSETRRAIAAIVTAVTRGYNYTSLAELNAVLQTFHVLADRGPAHTQMHRRQGLVYSITDSEGRKRGVPVKASALPGKPTLARLEQFFLANKAARRPFRESLIRRLDQVLSASPPLRRQAFRKALAQHQIAVLFRESAQGLTYGITFVDHRHRAVFNGSELGKQYSAKALTAHFTPEQAPALAAAKAPPLPDTRPGAFPSLLAETGRETVPFLENLLQAGQQGDYLPNILQPKRRKRKRKRPNL